MAYLFFDNASTTPCCEAALEHLQRFTLEEFGNPSSSHAMGKKAAGAIQAARETFAGIFKVAPPQVVFTGSGSESDNLAIYGVALDAIAKKKPAPRILCSSIEHPAVRKTMLSLAPLGVEPLLIPVDSSGQIDRSRLLELLTPETILVSIHRVNNIIGSLLPVEELAELVKSRVPGALFHTDAVQAFGRVMVPMSPSKVDLVSISAHKVSGPKGVGALIVLNPALLKDGLRPLIWGGDQEGGLRSGTQSAGLIAGFQAAAEKTLQEMPATMAHVGTLRSRLAERLQASGLLSDQPGKGRISWNSPRAEGMFVPYIVNLSAPGFPGSMVAKLLEERNCLVSTGSACSSGKMEPDPVLTAMGLPAAVRASAIRISFSTCNSVEDVDTLASALAEALDRISGLMSGTALAN